MDIKIDRFSFVDGLSDNEIFNFSELHLGVVLGLLTIIFTDCVCPDLIAESDENLIGSYFKLRSDGTFEFDSDNFSQTRKLFYEFDPTKLVCKKQLEHIQFMAKLMSQTCFLMSLSEIQVFMFLFLNGFSYSKLKG